MFDLNGLTMRVVSTSANGVVGQGTTFHFHQDGASVWAEYGGGRILRGYLVGTLRESELTFRYCQLQTDGVIDGGASRAEVRRHNGRVQVVEHFEWASRAGGGTNVFEECEPAV